MSWLLLIVSCHFPVVESERFVALQDDVLAGQEGGRVDRSVVYIGSHIFFVGVEQSNKPSV